EIQVLQEVDTADGWQLHLRGLPKDGLTGVLEDHLQSVADRSREQQRDVVGTRAHECRADNRQRIARTVPQSLKLVEYDDEVIRQRAQSDELCVQRLGILRGIHGSAFHRTLDDLDVEADLLLQRADLALSGPSQTLDWVTDHRVVHAPDKARDAHNTLEVDL